MAQLDALVNDHPSDSSFAETPAADPEGTPRSNGIDPTPEPVAVLRALDPSSSARRTAVFGKPAAAC